MEDKIIAIYLRSSVEQDVESRNAGNIDESDTIANQRMLLHKAAIEKGFLPECIIEYTDDGHSGVKFDRPAFQQMIADVEAGKVQAVMVKDLSRLGRDYIGVGEYVEQFFPARGVRLISINDNWDSDEHVGETMELDTTFRTMLYDMYSRDLSVKRKSANAARNKQGVCTMGFMPYGYLKNPEDRNKWIVDETTAPVVKRIFELFNAGEKMGVIAKILTEEGAPSPAEAKKESHPKVYDVHRHDIWRVASVSRILRNELYTGTLLLNRYSIKEYKSGTCVRNPDEEVFRFENNHEAIISKEDFEKAQKRMATKERASGLNREVSMPIYCGHCGTHLSETTRNEGVLNCKHGDRMPIEPCGQIQVRKEVMKGIIVKAINTQAKLLLKETKKAKPLGKKMQKLTKQADELNAEKERYRGKRIRLYKSFKAEEIDMDRFLKVKADLIRCEEEVQAELDKVEAELAAADSAVQNAAENAEEYKNLSIMKEYDADLVRALIERVEVFNDGHIRIKWKLESPFGVLEGSQEVDETGSAEETVGTLELSGDSEIGNVGGNSVVASLSEKKTRSTVAAYTSDLFMMPQEDCSPQKSKEAVIDYCRTHHYADDPEDIRFYYDEKTESLYYREGYMKFIDCGRRGEADVLAINSFKDLYLSHHELNNLLFWVIPKLSCRFISVADRFDSSDTDEAEQKALFEKYSSVRKSDQMRFASVERKAGRRKAAVLKVPECTQLFGYINKEDGSYADPEILNEIRKIYEIAKGEGKLRKATVYLNEHGVVTPQVYRGMVVDGDKSQKWYAEKVWNVIKNEGYAGKCKHYERCMELGKHCEREALVSREVFDEVNAKCKYRNR